MSVQNQTVKNVYAGNGFSTVFPYTFALLESDGDHVHVYITDENGISTETDNFTIDTTTRAITYPKVGDPLPIGQKIVIRRELPIEQELNLENLGPYFAEDVEGAMDRTVMEIQQLAEGLRRAVKVDVSEDYPAEDTISEIKNIKAYKDAAESSASAAAVSAESAANSATSAGNSASAASVSASGAAATLREGESLLASTAEYARQVAQEAAGIHEAAIPPWNPQTVYSYPTVVAYTDGQNYRCIGENVPAGTIPPTSNAWVRITTSSGDDFWEVDLQGGIQPRVNPTYAACWALDSDGNIQPRGLDDEITLAAETRAEQAALEAAGSASDASDSADAAAASALAAQNAEDHIDEIVTAATLIELDADDNITTKDEEESEE